MREACCIGRGVAAPCLAAGLLLAAAAFPAAAETVEDFYRGKQRKSVV